MNKYAIIIIGAIILFSFTIAFDPITNDVSVDEMGTAILFCTVLHEISEKAFQSETASDSALDFLQNKFGCK